MRQLSQNFVGDFTERLTVSTMSARRRRPVMRRVYYERHQPGDRDLWIWGERSFLWRQLWTAVICAPVAQRLEQQTHNLLVRGSNPCGGTN
jgi:hypothetical protein